MSVRVDMRVEAAIQEVADLASKGLALAGEHILGVSNEHVPLEYGDLQGSGVVSVDGLEAAVSYNTPYAVRQHEELDWQHDSGRTAKFLENAVNSEADTARQIIADTVRNGIGT